MPMQPEADIRHRRTPPPEWPDILNYAHALRPRETADGRLGIVPAMRMYRRCNQLPEEALESNAYYALGIVMCNIVRLLKDPAMLDETIQETARGMLITGMYIRSLAQDEPYQPYIEDLNSNLLGISFKKINRVAIHMLPAKERLAVLGTHVSNAANRYRHIRRHRAISRESARMHLQFVSEIQSGVRMAYSLNDNAFAGAGGVLSEMLQLARRQEGHTENPAQSPIDLSTIHMRDYYKNAIAAAKLRLDEFASAALVIQKGEDHIIFNQQLLANPPTPRSAMAKPPGHRHNARLACPAVQAGQLALIVARDILPPAIERAKTLTPADSLW